MAHNPYLATQKWTMEILMLHTVVEYKRYIRTTIWKKQNKQKKTKKIKEIKTVPSTKMSLLQMWTRAARVFPFPAVLSGRNVRQKALMRKDKKFILECGLGIVTGTMPSSMKPNLLNLAVADPIWSVLSLKTTSGPGKGPRLTWRPLRPALPVWRCDGPEGWRGPWATWTLGAPLPACLPFSGQKTQSELAPWSHLKTSFIILNI